MSSVASHTPDSVFVSKSQKGYLARMALMDASIKLIAEKGISGFSINELCKAAGLRRTSFYTYFDSIDDLVAQVSLREDSEFDDRLKEEFPDLERGLLRLVLNISEFFRVAQEQSLWNEFVIEMLTHHGPSHDAMKSDVRTDVEHAVAAGELDLNDDESLVFAGLTISSLFVALDLKERGKLNADTTYNVMDMLLKASGADPELANRLLTIQRERWS